MQHVHQSKLGLVQSAGIFLPFTSVFNLEWACRPAVQGDGGIYFRSFVVSNHRLWHQLQGPARVHSSVGQPGRP